MIKREREREKREVGKIDNERKRKGTEGRRGREGERKRARER